jgi:predicted outer membrane lipoprotein
MLAIWAIRGDTCAMSPEEQSVSPERFNPLQPATLVASGLVGLVVGGLAAEHQLNSVTVANHHADDTVHTLNIQLDTLETSLNVFTQTGPATAEQRQSFQDLVDANRQAVVSVESTRPPAHTADVYGSWILGVSLATYAVLTPFSYLMHRRKRA